MSRPDAKRPPTRPARPAKGPGLRSAVSRPAVWPGGEPLFPPLNADFAQALECLPEVLAHVWPLSAAHRRSLPADVAALSRLLTVERRELRRPYWSSPAFVSAYLYYFLPWNLVRLGRLLGAMPLPDPCALAPEGGAALLVDVGSGPLSLPLALWLARPEWRAAPVRVLALDSASRPPELGRAIMAGLAGRMGWPAWSVRTVCGSLESLPKHAAPLLRGKDAALCRPWLVTAANVLNELRPSRKGGAGALPADADAPDGTAHGTASGEDRGDVPGNERLEGVLDALAPLLFPYEEGTGRPAPGLLFVEPGTRLGGMTIMRLRALAVEGGLVSESPCPHDAPCPLLSGQGGRTWCHFTFDSAGAPSWLVRLSQEAGLNKSGLSLSPLLLRPALPVREGSAARVLSAPFLVPGLAGRARYACTPKGLALLEDAERLPSGTLLPVRLTGTEGRDARSRALIVPRPAGPVRQHGKKQYDKRDNKQARKRERR
ncbi:MAG: small ribosomal subunit Rsm22 family protein [Desulfovibrionaceae bacterium]|nr:small ribosomal subunit Rsm22 family protein [Desulfovibrionaceae bacterium]